MAFLHRHRWLTPYLLLAPGLAFLIVFFVIPLYYLGYTSLQEGTVQVGYTFTWAWDNYSNAFSTYQEQFWRSLEYAGIATVAAFLISYPLTYWIAFRGGRWKNLLLLFIIAPFFVTYLIRTLAWQNILSGSSPTTAGSLPPRPRSSPASRTTSCPSWRSRST
jgi:spermidine/putrescine transport system permease protein